MGHYLLDPLQFEFMRRALVAVVLTGVVSGVLGSYVVLRGMAFIGDALSHAVFPGIVIAVALRAQHPPGSDGGGAADRVSGSR